MRLSPPSHSFSRAVDDIFNKDFVGFEEIENCK
jgi:hypothetical protein